MAFRTALAAALAVDLGVTVVPGEPRDGEPLPHVALFVDEPDPLNTLDGDDRSLVRLEIEAGCRDATPEQADALAEMVVSSLAAVEAVVLAGRRVVSVLSGGTSDAPPRAARYPIDAPDPGVTVRAVLMHSPAA